MEKDNDNKLNNSDIIKRAIESLKISVKKSILPINEQVALDALLGKIDVYYDKKLEIINNRSIDINSNQEQVMILKTFVTDILVEINSVLTGENDIYYFTSVISKRINDKEINRFLRSKK